MTKLSNYSTWKAEAVPYWETYIDTTVAGFTFEYTAAEIQAIKDEMYLLMNDFDAKVTAYNADDSRRGPFIESLFALANYVVSKYLAYTPDAPVGDITLLPTGKATDLFAYWRQDLPDYTTLFDVVEVTNADPLIPPTLELAQVTYPDAIAAFDGYIGDDISRLNAAMVEITNTIRERAAYLLFKGQGATVVRGEGTLNEYILVDFGVQQVLDQFTWVIKGLNG